MTRAFSDQRLTELVVRRHELLDQINKATSESVMKSLRRELKSVSREAQRFSSSMLKTHTKDEVQSAIRKGMAQISSASGDANSFSALA